MNATKTNDELSDGVVHDVPADLREVLTSNPEALTER
jgi:hypothetical protein